MSEMRKYFRFGLLKKVPFKLKRNIYLITTKPEILYVIRCQLVRTKKQVNSMYKDTFFLTF